MRITNSLLLCLVALASFHISMAKTTQRELGGTWEFKEASSPHWYEAAVPGCVHSDLLRNGVIEDPYYRENEKRLQWIDKKEWQYRSKFIVSDKELISSMIELRFLGLDTYADVYLNGHRVLYADNMFREWRIDAKKYLKSGENEIFIHFYSPITVGLKEMKKYGYILPANNDQALNGELMADELVSVYVRKAPYHFGWDWGPRFVTSGVWKPIVLTFSSDTYIDDVYYRQNKVNSDLADVTAIVSLKNVNIKDNAKVIIKDNATGKVIAAKALAQPLNSNEIAIPICFKNPKLWWTRELGEQNLYDLSASIVVNDQVISSKDTRIGLRSIRVVEEPDKDTSGISMCFELNGIPIFIKGVNHIPNDMFVDRMTRDVYQAEIQGAVDANMNMIRIWGGGIYELDVLYELCDENGILVWQDFMFACSMYPGNEQFLESIRAEAEDNVKRLRNHASIALWCGNNEIDTGWQHYNPEAGWGWKNPMDQKEYDRTWKAYVDIFKVILPKVVSELNPEIDYRHSSPIAAQDEHASYFSTKKGDMHYWDVWHGRKPFDYFNRALGRFVSEYGFQSFPEMRTIREYALPEDYNIESSVMKAHQRSDIGNEVIRDYMKLYYNVPDKFEDFIYIGQVLQAEAVRYAIEAHRGNKPYTMGTLYWQINDCWPVASWSSMDYYRRWKALHYFTKKAFEPILATVQVRDDKLLFIISSDKLKPICGATVTVEHLNSEGKLIKKLKYKTTIPKNSAVEIAKVNKSDFDTSDDSFVVIKLVQGKIVLAENIYYPRSIKEQKFTTPNLKINTDIEGDNICLNISSDVLVKNLYLYNDMVDGFYSDNYFDVLPGREYKIKFTPKDRMQVGKFVSALKYNHIEKVFQK